MKRQNQFLIANAIRTQLGRTRFQKPVHISYHFFEPNRKRDLDNISAVAHKFVQDALVKCGTLENDGWNNVVGFTDTFSIDRHNPRIIVTIKEV